MSVTCRVRNSARVAVGHNGCRVDLAEAQGLGIDDPRRKGDRVEEGAERLVPRGIRVALGVHNDRQPLPA
jgi:hypothetical protein